MKEQGGRIQFDTVPDILEHVRVRIGVSPSAFAELTMGQVLSMRAGVVVGARWTRGEMAAISEHGTDGARRGLLRMLDDRGPSVIDWTDDREPCERCGSIGEHSDQCRRMSEEECAGEEAG
jgi:hypothetical protein